MTSLNQAIREPDFLVDRSNLVEASAGTGKTYCLQTLFLRLVVEHGYKVGEILTVTFTDAATRELRDRLRAVLRECLLALDGSREPGSCDQRIIDILGLPLRNIPAGKHEEHVMRRLRVRDALRDFDQASIFTIHGFCNRALSRYAFECAHDFGAELTENRNDRLGRLCEDWWRAKTYAAQQVPILMILNAGIKLGKLKKLVSKRVSRPYARLLPDAGEVVATDEEVMAKMRAMTAVWNRDEVLQALVDAQVSLTKLPAVTRNRIADMLDRLKDGEPAADIDLLVKFTKKFFSQEKVLKKSSSGPPSHLFFARCGEFLEVFLPALSHFLPRAIEDIRAGYEREKHLQQTLSYDDLLLNMHKALSSPETGEQLLASLRRSYRVLLIDEFQDTDPVQYGIFRKIFHESGLPVFMVGDPKQAIYSFRGGDIFTYYAAAGEVEESRRYTLNRNWRSEARLVDAINLLFMDRESGPTFINENIRFAGDQEAEGKPEDACLKISGRVDPAPLKILHYTGIGGKPPAKKSRATFRIYSDVADEISRLLNDRNTLVNGRRLVPSDFAVLVLVHDEARDIAGELRQRNIPVVIQRSGRIFDSPEAQDMRFLLVALINPARIDAVCTALATDLFPCTDQQIRTMLGGMTAGRTGSQEDGSPAKGFSAEPEVGDNSVPATMEGWLDLFHDAHSAWRQGSFLPAFALLAGGGGLAPHLVGTENGERRLTNILQLAQLVNQAANGEGFTMEETLNWFLRQCRGADFDDAPELRLESDDDAVKILTVFKSKGLEFPIVFVPTMWRKQPDLRNNVILQYHGCLQEGGIALVPGEPEPCILDLRTDNDAARNRVKNEMREEQVRLFYVAATRAINRCYLVWGDFGGESPLRAVLGDKPKERLESAWQGEGGLPVEFMERSIEHASQPVMYVPAAGQVPELKTADEIFAHPGFTVDRSHGHASFSSLSPYGLQGVGAVHEKYDFDQADNAAEPASGEAAGESIFSFPAGARTGNCWHSIFEHLDFQADSAGIEAVVREEMSRYGFYTGQADAGRLELVSRMVGNVMAAPLPVEPRFCLQQVGREDRISELEFSFSLPDREEDICTARIFAILKKHWQGRADRQVFLDRLVGWNHPVPRGFLTGAIDLVFRHEQRYYIADWKSNRIDGRPQSFAPQRLSMEMAANAYFLQYLLYTVAMHNYLKGCLAGYSYQKHFGGAFYLFLRGVDSNGGQGIFFDRPGEELIMELSDLLV